MPIRSIERSNGTVHVSVADDLTTRDLELIRDALSAGRGGHVQVDLRAARHVPPPQLVELARRLEELGATYDLSGLSRSNHRLLKILGVQERTRRPV